MSETLTSCCVPLQATQPIGRYLRCRHRRGSRRSACLPCATPYRGDRSRSGGRGRRVMRTAHRASAPTAGAWRVGPAASCLRSSRSGSTSALARPRGLRNVRSSPLTTVCEFCACGCSRRPDQGWTKYEAGSKSPCNTRGSRSAPLGHATVPRSSSTRTCAKKPGSASGSNTGPCNSPVRSTSRELPSLKPTLSR